VFDILDFKAQVSGLNATEKVNRIQVWPQHLSNWQLANRFERDRPAYCYWALGGVGSTSLSLRVQDGGKTRHT